MGLEVGAGRGMVGQTLEDIKLAEHGRIVAQDIIRKPQKLTDAKISKRACNYYYSVYVSDWNLFYPWHFRFLYYSIVGVAMSPTSFSVADVGGACAQFACFLAGRYVMRVSCIALLLIHLQSLRPISELVDRPPYNEIDQLSNTNSQTPREIYILRILRSRGSHLQVFYHSCSILTALSVGKQDNLYSVIKVEFAIKQQKQQSYFILQIQKNSSS